MTEQVIVYAPLPQGHFHGREEMVLALLQSGFDIHGANFLGFPTEDRVTTVTTRSLQGMGQPSERFACPANY